MKIWKALLLLALPLGNGYAAQPFSVQTLNQLNKVHSGVLSKDGLEAIYAITTVDGKHSQSDLYRHSTQMGMAPQRLTFSDTKEHSVSYSSDGKGVYFLSNRSGSSQLWYLPLAGGEARQISDFPIAIDGYKFDRSGNKVVMQFRVPAQCASLTCAQEHADAEPSNTGKHYQQLMVRHWDSWGDELRNQLFVAQNNGLSLSEPINITFGMDTEIPSLPFSGMEEVTFTPDGNAVVFAAKAPSREQSWQTNYDLWRVPTIGGDPVNLTADNLAWDSHPVFSPNGRYMAWLAMSIPGYEADRFRIMLKDLNSGKTKEVAPNWDRSPSNLFFGNDDHSLFVSAQDTGQVAIFSIDTRFGDMKKLVSEGSNRLLAVAGDNILYGYNRLDKPNELYVMNTKGRGAHPLTKVNEAKLADSQLGEFEQFSFKGWNDETVYGYWIKPVGYQQGQKYPVAFLVHGGPQGSFGNRWHGRWNGQLWAAAGFGVVMIDFHGSTGYGSDFTHSISKDWGGKPLEDLQKGLAAVGEQQPWLDTDNACAAGGSYGGYMMNWIAGNWPSGFKCLVNHAGLFDMRSFYMVTEELWFPEYEFGGTYWDATERYEQFNPVNHIDKWQTPMLVVHGATDYRVPLEQGLAAFTVLQRKGIQSELLVFPDENHWILDKDNLVQWYDGVLGWMKRFTEIKAEPAVATE